MDPHRIRKDFPALRREVFGKPIVYLDNCATTLKPEIVIIAIASYYENYCANIYRGAYLTSVEATSAWEFSREKIAGFIGARPEELIFVRNATEGLNLVAQSLSRHLGPGDEVVTTLIEHHSNMLPWWEMSRVRGFKLKLAKVTREGTIDYEDLKEKVTGRTRVVAVSHVSNVTGAITDLRLVRDLARDVDAVFVVDGAQSAPHIPIDVKKIDADAFAFSGHKMMGPTGIGGLYLSPELKENLPRFLVGGETIEHVHYDPRSERLEIEWKAAPEVYEAGTPHIAGAIGLAAAVDYIEKLGGPEEIRRHEEYLVRVALRELSAIPGVEVYGPPPKERGGVVPFNVQRYRDNPHEVSLRLDRYGICTRSGHHCAEPLHEALGVPGTVRASFYIYNTREEIEYLAQAVEEIAQGALPTLEPVYWTNPLEDLLTSGASKRESEERTGLTCATCAFREFCMVGETGHLGVFLLCPALEDLPNVRRAFWKHEAELLEMARRVIGDERASSLPAALAGVKTEERKRR